MFFSGLYRSRGGGARVGRCAFAECLVLFWVVKFVFFAYLICRVVVRRVRLITYVGLV